MAPASPDVTLRLVDQSDKAFTVVPISGMLVPVMGTKGATTPSSLASALFSPVQQRVLGLLFGQPERRFQSAELIRLADSGTGAVHRQLTRLRAAGWVITTREGNQKYYQVNMNCPAYAELQGLIAKTVGLAGAMSHVLQPLESGIKVAFIYGSIAKGTDHAASDIDLFVISEQISYPELFEALEPAERTLGRAINPTLMTPSEWRERIKEKDSFVGRVTLQPRTFVIGGIDDLS